MNKSVSSIFKLHNKTLENFLCEGQLNQLKDDFLVRSKHTALGNKVDQECSNLAGSASDCNSHWWEFEVRWGCWEVTTNLLEACNDE